MAALGGSDNTGMARKPRLSSEISDAFAEEQKRGLMVALIGRFAFLLMLAVWIGTTRSAPQMYYMIGGIAGFAALGLAQLWVVRKAGVRAWLLYLFMFLEISILTIAIAGFSGPMVYDLPVTLGFRFENFLYFFLFIASAAFSYSPLLVLWSGVSVAISWGLASAWIVSVENTHGWEAIPDTPTRDEYLAIFLDPMFFGVGSRMQEALILLSVAGLLAIVAMRARTMVIRQAESERARAEVADIFGKYVPEAVAGQLIADAGALEPQERIATILISDIENFTGISEKMTPSDVLDMLNDYFESVGEIIARHGGVVGQFHGDAVIAMFNVPVEQEDHATSAIEAAREIESRMAETEFRGQILRTRVGVNTGKIVSGSVGSAGRRSYTIYGDAVNTAARIEAMNKDYGTYVLVADATVEQASENLEFEALGTLTVRGKTEPTTIYSVVE